MKKINFCIDEILIIALIIIDQIVKIIIDHQMLLFQKINVLPFFRLYKLYNQGIAFSFFEKFDYLVIAISIIAITLLFYMKNKEEIQQNQMKKIAIILIISGAIGNLIDRLFYGYVIDYISLHLNGYEFAIFNLADTYIFFGVVCFLYQVYKEEDKS